MNITLRNAFFLLLVFSVSAQTCHYSCSSCTDSSYIHCTACKDASTKLIPIGISNTNSYGLCSTPAQTGPSGLGVFLLLSSIASGLFLRSQHIFYFIFTFQIFGLLSLIEVAYTPSLTTILDSFQYFMIFSKMQYSHKTTDSMLQSRQMYRLSSLLNSVGIDTNFTAIFVVVFVVAIILAIFLIFKHYRGKNCQCISESALDNLLTAFRTVILLTMQQMLLIVYTGIRFDSLSAGQMAMIVLYCLIVVFLLVDLNWNRVPYFKAKKLLNLVIAQRLILPVFVIIPYDKTYHLIIFMIGFGVVQLLFFVKSQGKTRHYLYSTLRIVCSILTGVFIAVELASNSLNSSKIAGIVATISFALFIVAFIAQQLISLKEKCIGGSKIENQEDLLVRQNTKDSIPVRREDTLADIRAEGSLKTSSGEKRNQNIFDNQERMPNLLEERKRMEKKFKVHKK